ncbi:uncharacterized protein LOC113343479 [Papaver somniferum]|uniref:uncharacterized protein LOC113343479 n=1 Tax=Papaver somniferum TaxID=3469 RepID=UPI000E704B6C|nr:uncharacterized protein LOC113343479 [Papaver somniferum]
MVILEAVASFDRWFWHGFFGKPGSNNDINVLNHSDVLDDVNNSVAPRCEFVVNGHMYYEGYYLADDIYPRYKVLVVAYKESILCRKKKLFNKYQEAKRKDVERDFGTLKRKFAIVNNPCMYWKKSDMKSIMRGCMIMHNMVVENEYCAQDWDGFQENAPIIIENPVDVYMDSEDVDPENDAYPPEDEGEVYGNFFEDGE